MPVLTINHCLAGCRVAGIGISIEEIRHWYHISHHHLLWIMTLKAIGVQCQLPCQKGWKASSIPNVADDIRRLKPTWRLIYPSLKMRMQRIPLHSELEVGLDCIPLCKMQGSHPCSICHLVLSRVPWGATAKFRDGYNLRWYAYHSRQHYNNLKALDALNQELFQLQMADKETVLDWGICLLRHLQVLATSFPECFPPN